MPGRVVRRPTSPRTWGVVVWAGVAAAVLAACGEGTVTVDSPTVDPGTEEACRALVDDLPDTVADQLRRSVDPDDALGAAWGDPAIVLTCGVSMPSGFDAYSACDVINGVGWYVADDVRGDQSRDVDMTTVGLEPAVRVHLPAPYRPEGYAATAADLTPALKEHLTAKKRCV